MNLFKSCPNSATFLLNDGWNFEYNDRVYDAKVPGDITLDLYEHQLIDDPCFSDNYRRISWVFDRDWTYRCLFHLSAQDLLKKVISLSFDMVDTFATVYVNGHEVGQTDSMFHAFSFDVKNAVQEGDNELKVVLHSIRKAMADLHNTTYKGTFSNDRVLIRKAQCHFGWDWAPDFPGTGIAGDVKLYVGDGYLLANVFPETELDGRVGFIIESAKNNRFPGEWEETKGFSLVLKVEQTPGSGLQKVYEKKTALFGQKNLLNVKIENPQLWYPNGYGAQPLYHYWVELQDEKGLVRDSLEGHFGIRSILVDESPYDDERRYFRFIVNNQPIRVLGSNWVPAMALTGAISAHRYQTLLKTAKDAGFSMLRVWGGGIYEKELFYDLCDHYGILVWQDFMFACQFIPDDTEAFRSKITEEATFQIKRLRSKTCLALYSAGNELGNAFVVDRAQKMSDYSQYVLLAGLVNRFDGTRKYVWDSPYALTDVGNDPTSGDSHSCALDEAFDKGGLSHFRDFEERQQASFFSEVGLMGMCRIRSLKRFMPEDKLWPFNPLWEERMSSNPYFSVPSFVERQALWASTLFGPISDLADFCKKSMVTQSESLRSECEYARADGGNSGFLNWMFNDIWGTGTWSLVDSYYEKKPAYYALKRAGARQNVEIVQKEGSYEAVVINDTAKPWKGTLAIREESLADGPMLKEEKRALVVPPFSLVKIPYVLETKEKGYYLHASYAGVDCVYFYDYWLGKSWKSDLSVSSRWLKGLAGHGAVLKIKANAFARLVALDLKNGVVAEYSDNYFDLPEGREKRVTITSDKRFSLEDIRVLTYADSWNE